MEVAGGERSEAADAGALLCYTQEGWGPASSRAWGLVLGLRVPSLVRCILLNRRPNCLVRVLGSVKDLHLTSGL